ncbi:RecQ family ATP-dependent DNA helicase [Alkalilimnicola ehrlichii]|uniref:RecQ family ATP-dependent DNA helicase n=1 Tax=Alkalilimnicola ehrlichii TaxID=351052 RepID=UPI00216117E0|nr:RecQ family ATP-dependent DNA helicase [Alkalilimnicola ehrlichii]
MSSLLSEPTADVDVAVDAFLGECLLVDLETGRRGKLYEIGAIHGADVFARRDVRDERRALAELDAFGRSARFVFGHNVLAHDLPYVRTLSPELELLQKPVVDTLYLSALAFPENPYHRLVKDYKLVRDSVSDPVADARLAGSIFRDQWASFRKFGEFTPGILEFYRFCFQHGDLEGENGSQGLAAVFAGLGAKSCDGAEMQAIWLRLTEGRACPVAARRIAAQGVREPQRLPALAYVLAWLFVAGGNSVLPPWVRHRFPVVSDLIKALRDSPCGASDCPYCARNHDPVVPLKALFGYPSYRPAADGRELQREIVAEGMCDRPLLAILPTGGGKSICYQIPALVRYQRRGVLTVVVSPLQALMKDQVDNLKQKTGTNAAAALYGMLTPPERASVLEGIKLGDVALLYVSPEQLRNRSLRQALLGREVGCWVFDEAHCLSKWGHDFRPDYLYAARFIRELTEEQRVPLPPVACFTATAKTEVVADILGHFKRELGQELSLLDGGAERENLRFEVHEVSRQEKFARAEVLLRERLGEPPVGGAVIYCATRRNTEEVAEYLQKLRWNVEAFHAGLPAPEKRAIQERFVAGEIPVICATNAFGMGIDKDDVRLVIHLDIPGSLENYLQEAGRAGRDEQEAECILLYDTADVETQFKLGAISELNKRDISQILRGLRRVRRGEGEEIVVTSGELLREETVSTSFDAGDNMADTKVKTAVAWLERAGFLERNENHTRVFQGKPVVQSLDEAEERLQRLNLPDWKRRQWLEILTVLINADPDEGITADDLAGYAGVLPPEAREEDEGRALSDTQRVIQVLHQMTEAGLISKGLQMTAYLRPRGKGNARAVLERVCAIEDGMLKALEEAAPDAEAGQWQQLSLRQLNQRLKDQGFDDANPEILRQLLNSLSQDGKGMAGRRGSIDLKHTGNDSYRVKLQRNWAAVKETAQRRRAVAQAVLAAIYARVPEAQASSTAVLLVEFTSDDLLEAIKQDMALAAQIRDPLAAIDRGLLFLHEQKAIILQRGLAVFRQAMTISLLPGSKGRRYTKGDFEPLEYHYRERTFQVHVMNEYARLGLEKISQAMRLVADYFSQEKKDFVRRYFPGRESILQRATSEESYRAVVESLGNPAQEAIVTAPLDSNALILAGPGAGKTRTVVHRCAYLLRVERVPARGILILCFNHNAKLTLRKRLWELVGRDAVGVTVLTYHGLAMRLTGASFAARAGQDRTELRFEGVVADAIALLRGDKEVPGLEDDELRDRLLAGYQHILVDEYQDIDPEQYDLISALAGRTLEDPDRKLSLLAVGDDDQSIYGFRNANVGFIRQFREDYDAEVHHLVENYRSTANIIAAANQLIAQNRDRMKLEHPIRIDKGRHNQALGGVWQRRDELTQGKVQILGVPDLGAQAAAVVGEIERLRRLQPEVDWGISRSWHAPAPGMRN